MVSVWIYWANGRSFHVTDESEWKVIAPGWAENPLGPFPPTPDLVAEDESGDEGPVVIETPVRRRRGSKSVADLVHEE